MGDKKYIKVERHKWPDEIAEEKKKTRKRVLIVFLCLLCFGLGAGFSYFASSINTIHMDTTASKFDVIYDVMLNEWYFGKDIEDLDTFLMDNAITGLTTNEYDIHTNYMDAERTATYLEKLEGNIDGIGISIAKLGEEALITRVYPNTPAQKAGLQANDIILKVNGVEVKDKTAEEISTLTKGEKGSKVTYEIKRGNEIKTLEMKRETLSLTTYAYEVDGVDIIEINSISENTDKEVEEHFKRLKEEDVNDIIIDLRNNTGGYVSTALNICSMLVGKGKTAFYEIDKEEKITEYKTVNKEVYEFENIVILVNENTASAAELITTCLSKYLDTTVVGTTTYGKGTIQISKMFTDGSYIKYTIGEWLNADKEKIHKKGITPDVEVSLEEALSIGISDIDTVFHKDEIGVSVKEAQIYLGFLGFDCGREDGYFSQGTLDALHAYQKANGLEYKDTICAQDNLKMQELVSKRWYFEKEELDTQLIKAVEIAKES